MRTLIAAGAALIALTGGGLAVASAQEAEPAAATSEEEEASPYTVIEENARIPFADSRINGFRVGLDRSLILEVGARRYYRAELDRSCARELRWQVQIGVRIPRIGTLQRNDDVVIEDRRCRIYALDEIADPRPVEAEARAEEAAQ